MKYEHIISAVYDTPWAILPSKLTVITDMLRFRAEGGQFTAEEIRERIGAADGLPPGHPMQPSRAGAIAVLPLVGVITHRANLMSETSGGTSVELFTKAFRQVMGDPSISAVIIDVDSPGGDVSGMEELSAEIFKARSIKPIVAVANSMAASAAFWIATAASELVVTPSADIGSVGVIAAHEDHSAELEEKGVKVTLVSAGKFKTEGNPFGPLTDEAKAALQSRVDDHMRMFVATLARNRGVSTATVRNDFGQGRVVGAKDAVRLGMADRVGTLDETIARLASRAGRRRGAGALSGQPVVSAYSIQEHINEDEAFNGTDQSMTTANGTGFDWTDDDEEQAAAMAAEPERDGLGARITCGKAGCYELNCRAIHRRDPTGEVEVAEADLAATQARRR